MIRPSAIDAPNHAALIANGSSPSAITIQPTAPPSSVAAPVHSDRIAHVNAIPTSPDAAVAMKATSSLAWSRNRLEANVVNSASTPPEHRAWVHAGRSGRSRSPVPIRPSATSRAPASCSSGPIHSRLMAVLTANPTANTTRPMPPHLRIVSLSSRIGRAGCGRANWAGVGQLAGSCDGGVATGGAHCVAGAAARSVRASLALSSLTSSSRRATSRSSRSTRSIGSFPTLPS